MSTGQRNFRVIWVTNFVTAVGMMSFLPLLPLYIESLGVTDPAAARIWSGVILAGAPLPAALLGPVWGALGDRIGRKLMIARANLAIVVFVGLMGFVTSPWQLLALRLGQGVFSGFVAPAMTLVSVTTPPERQGRTAGHLQAAVTAGAVLGPLIGGPIGDAFGYRSVFFVCSALSAVALLLVSTLATEPARESTGGVNVLELLQSVLRDVASLLGAPGLRGVLLSVFAVRFGASLVDPVMAFWVEGLEGVPAGRLATATALVFGVHAAAMLLFSGAWGRAGDRHGFRRMFIACSLGTGLTYLAQGFVGHIGPMLALRMASGVFVAGIVPAAFAAASRHSSTEQRGSAYGFTFSSVILARALAPLAGGVFAATIGLRALFVIAAALMIGAALVVGRSARRASKT